MASLAMPGARNAGHHRAESAPVLELTQPQPGSITAEAGVTYKRAKVWDLGAEVVYVTRAQRSWGLVLWVITLFLAGFAGAILALVLAR